MGYDIAITKDAEQTYPVKLRFTQEELMHWVEQNPIYLYETQNHGNEVSLNIYVRESTSSVKYVAWFIDGRLRIKNPDDASLVRFIQLGQALGANIIGDEGEHYSLVDGKPVPKLPQFPDDPPQPSPLRVLSSRDQMTLCLLLSAAVVLLLWFLHWLRLL